MEQMKSQAEKEYPRECCGLLLGLKTSKEYSRALPCRNVQDEYHSKDPKNFPRTSKKAYFLDPKELLLLQKDARARGEEIKLIYHSHIDGPSHFSEEDHRMATYEGTPVYPGVEYLIFSVRGGKVVGVSLYAWNENARQYREALS